MRVSAFGSVNAGSDTGIAVLRTIAAGGMPGVPDRRLGCTIRRRGVRGQPTVCSRVPISVRFEIDSVDRAYTSAAFRSWRSSELG